MTISVDRIRADIEAIARCTDSPGNGATRPTFSPAWAKARAYVVEQAKAAGCETRVDAAGNLHARPAALGWDAPAWLCGSHIDSVPHGGDFDGVAGVVVALELLRSAKDGGISALPVELVDFAEEEGPTFGLGMMGSRAWVGDIEMDRLTTLRNAGGQNYIEAGRAHGVDPARLAADRIDPQRYLGLIEVHIEQGPGMWRRDQRLAVVRAIAGRRQYSVTIHGEANHAGATAMLDRHDALAGAARVLCELESLAGRLSEHAVITIGRITNHPNAVNVIPDRVEFTIDFRAPDDATLEQGDGAIRKIVHDACARRKLRADLHQTESIAARPLAARLCDRLAAAARLAGVADLPGTVSGALHDSAVLAPHVATAMLFVPSKGGISHNPAELSRVEDIAVAAAVVEQVARRPTLHQLNTMSREQFVAVCGRLFEHSPWIADRAYGAGPFSSVSDLFEKLGRVVVAATDDERMKLIQAHPDLVGRLARDGKLTRESNHEQAAAGLSLLTDQEISAFEQHNAAYREKFGFPFIICARQNKKAAILEAMPRRLQNTREQEIATALGEIYKIAQLRLADAVWED